MCKCGSHIAKYFLVHFFPKNYRTYQSDARSGATSFQIPYNSPRDHIINITNCGWLFSLINLLSDVYVL